MTVPAPTAPDTLTAGEAPAAPAAPLARGPSRGCLWGCGGLLLLCSLGGWWLQRPSYLVLPIPMKAHPHEDFWYETLTAELHYRDGHGALYLHRRVDMAWESEGWKTTAQVMEHFDGWLRGHGWDYSAGTNEHILPESRFLEEGTEYRFYRRPGDRWGEGPLVAVAVEPLTRHGKFVEPRPFAYYVTLVTAKPSWLRRLADSFDD